MSEWFSLYWQEFLLIASAHALAVASPGPDFAIVLRQSLIFGRKFAIITSVGIGLAILIHVAYAVLGIGLLIKNTTWLYTAIQIAGAVYLSYIGIQALKSQKKEPDNEQQTSATDMTAGKAFRQGFITNVLNPKATVFFLSLFTTIISQTTPIPILVGYGLWMSFATACWFVFLSFILSSAKVRAFFNNFGYWIDRVLGIFLLGLAALLIWATVS